MRTYIVEVEYKDKQGFTHEFMAIVNTPDSVHRDDAKLATICINANNAYIETKTYEFVGWSVSEGMPVVNL